MKNQSAYRTDELILIIMNCNSLPELEAVLRDICYLTRNNIQIIHAVICEVSDLKEKQLLKQIKNAKNNKNRS